MIAANPSKSHKPDGSTCMRLDRLLMRKNNIPAQRRRQRGSGIVEGVVGLWLVVAGAVAGTLLIINTGMAVLYKQKVSYVASQTAAALSSQLVWLGVKRKGVTAPQIQERANKLANIMLRELGVPGAASVTVTDNKDIVMVQIKALPMPLFGKEFGLLTIEERGVAAYTTNQPPAICQIAAPNSTSSIVVPCYGSVGGPSGAKLGVIVAPGTTLVQHGLSVQGFLAAPGVYVGNADYKAVFIR